MSAVLPGGPVDARASAPTGQPSTRPKPQIPPDRGGTLWRARLIDQVSGSSASVVAITAPAGYGKSTLLGQLASRLPNVAYLRLDETDDDPTVLLADLIDAVETVTPLADGVRRAMATPAELTGFRGPARFTQALHDASATLSLLIDDLHLVTDRTALDWLAWILERRPDGVRVVLASRRETALPLGRLIADGQSLLLGPTDLALDTRETAQLAELSGVTLTAGAAAALAERTEGWAVATRLMLRSGAADHERPRPGDADITRYLRSELFDRMDAETRSWVIRSAVLEELSGPLCDQALATTGSLQTLRRLEVDNQLLLPQDPGRTTYRYHALYREFLLGELEAMPGERTAIAKRAADHLAAVGRVPEAARYVELTGNLDLLAAYVERHATLLYWSGKYATVQEWIARFDRDGVRERYATVAVLGAWADALHGDLVGTLRWLAAAERTTDRRTPFDGSSDHSGWIAAIRANVMPDGLAAHAVDVATALARLHPASPMRPGVQLQCVAAELMAGRLEGAEAAAQASEDGHRSMGATPGFVTLLALRASAALARGDVGAAREHVALGMQIVGLAGIEDYSASMPMFAVGARIAAVDGDAVTASAHLSRVNRLRPLVTAALPFYAVLSRVQAVRAAIALREPAMARTLLSEADEVLAVRPDMGTLVAEVEQLRPIVASLRAAQPGPWTLTAAELRLLSYLPTHLTFREIAQRMYLSPHTIKTQAMSIYGKLEVSSRREAIERAVAVNLLDASVLHQADGAALIA
jgi:LuxR family maltose regulon positive regulatory protein